MRSPKCLHPARFPAFLAIALCVTVSVSGCWEPPVIPRPATETYVDIRGHRTRYRTRKGTEPCHILYLHGFAASVETWEEMFARQPGGCSATALDHIGFGIADRPPPEQFSYGPWGHAEYARKLMDELGIRSAFLVGNSMGGAIAMTIARETPERADGIIVLDPKYQNVDLPAPLFLLRFPAFAELSFTFMTPLSMKMGLQRAYHDNRFVTEALVRRYHDPLDYPGSVPAWAASFLSLEKWSASWTPTEVPKITTPSLIIWGAEDLLLPPSDGSKLHAALPGSELEFIRNCGHVPQEEKPAETAALMERFIRRTLASRHTVEESQADAPAAPDEQGGIPSP